MGSAPQARGGRGWFAMEDYHTFSSTNLIDWQDHGVILNQKQVPWVNGNSNSMWAPDCVFRKGKYYFYFPSQNRIGVAIGRRCKGHRLERGGFQVVEHAIRGTQSCG